MRKWLLLLAFLPCLLGNSAPFAEPDMGQLLGTGSMASGDANDIITVTLATAQTSGRTVYAAFGSLTTSRTMVAPTDSQGGTWSQVRNIQNITNAETYLFVRTAGPTLGIGDTVSGDYNGTTYASAIVFDAIGTSTSESAGGAQGTTTSTPSAAASRTLTNSLSLAVVTENAAAVDGGLTQDADYTTLTNVQNPGANLRITVAYRDQTASGGDTYSPTLSGSRAVAVSLSDFGVPATVSKGGLIPMTGAGGLK